MILGPQWQTNASLDSFLRSIVVRLRAAALTRGFGALAATAFVVTAICVFLANRAAFSPASVIGSRAFLVAALATVVGLLLVVPLRRLARGRAVLRAADEAERRAPAFSGRLRTWADERERAAASGRAPSPLLALLAKETEKAAGSVPLDSIVNRAGILALGGAAGAIVLALIWLGTSGPGYWQYGTAKLWTGWFISQDEPLYELTVEPGDTTIRQGGRLDVTAEVFGFDPSTLLIYAKFESSVDWERAPMGPQLDGPGYAFSFSMVREPLRYYVEAGRLRSREFEVGVVAMPTVESIRLEYEYPEWSGLDPTVEDPGGDVMAVKGTSVAVILTTDKRLDDGLLVVGEEELPVRGNRAEIKVDEDSVYHVAAVYRGERVRLTEDYFITAVPDRGPKVEVLEPGRDWRASSIEEVPVRIRATDDFGLRQVKLHYAVNGVEQEPVDVSPRRGAKESTASHLFYLEELGTRAGTDSIPVATGAGQLPPPAPEAGLLPGDLISYYLAAEDAKRVVRSDIYFINIQPFERRFSQSQQAPGQQGGQGQQQDEISRRQKEIVIANWNLIKERDSEDSRELDKLRESSEMLSQLQTTLMQQAQTLAQRTRARQLTNADPKFAQFVEYMEQAASFMEPAAIAMQAFELDEAVAPAQQALQFLLRAENLFTDIQVSMGQGGGGGGGASRDLAEMFELEMDLEKNQYETGSGASGQELDQEIDEAMKKLEELARRQEQLAERAQDRTRASFEQRWQQEILRREAEDLKRDLEQLQRRRESQQGQRGQQAQQGQRGQQQAGGQPGQGQRGGAASGQQMEQAIQQLDRAARVMERAGRGGDPRETAASASRQLREAVESLAQQRREASQAAIERMADAAEALTDEQESTAADMQESLRVALEAIKARGGNQYGQVPTGMTREEEVELADRKRAMGEKLAGIERGMQEQARLLRERNEGTSRALLDALRELQESQALPLIQYATDLVQRGMAPYAASNEETVSRALRALSRDLREVQELAQAEGDGEDRGLARLLTDVERLRRGLEEAAGGGARDAEQGQGGQQPGSQRAGQRGGQGQGEDPTRDGGSRAGGANGERRGGWGGFESLGDGRWRGGFGPRPVDPQTLERMERALEEGVVQVPRLTQRARSSEDFDPRDVLELRQFAQELGDGRFLGNPELLEEEYRKMLALLEQLEVTLRRQVELDDKEEVRAIVSQPVPELYREAVAEYYRRLGGSQ